MVSNFIRRARPPRRFRIFGFCSVAAILLGLAGYGYYRREAALEPLIVMHSCRPYHEVHIPFVFYNGNLFVQASFGKRPVNCVLDTGTSIIECPPDLCPQAAYTGIFWTRFRPDSFTPPQTAAWRVMPAVTLGAYELRRCPLVSCRRGPVFYGSQPILGSPAFGGHVLTLDYRTRELVVRDAGYDITQASAEPGAALVDFRLYKGGSDFGEGIPVMAGTIAGQPAAIALDTGAAHFAVVGASLIETFGAGHSEEGSPQPFLPPGSRNLDSVPWSVGALHATDGVLLRPHFHSGDVTALLGQPVLEQYRVTIDYARRKALFEPDPEPDRLPSDDHAWTDQPWTGDDGPYRALRRAMSQEAARGTPTLDRLMEYALTARQRPDDPQAVFCWGYTALLASQGSEFPVTTLAPAREAMASVRSPHCAEFDRVRFLLEATGHRQTKGYLKGLGRRLVTHEPQDGDVMSYLVNILDVTRDPGEKRLALSYVRDADWPVSGRWLAALMRGSVYWRCWQRGPNPQDAQGALAAYTEYLRLGRPNDPRRQTAAEAVHTLSQRGTLEQSIL